MVINVTSLTQSGLRDWLVQRVSAVILGLYTIYVLAFLMIAHPITFNVWHQFFSSNFMRVFTLLALLSLVVHAWIGIWTILTDYVKPYLLRLAFYLILFISLLTYFVWGISILWGM